ncbi:MAG: hypothetical protein LBH42_02325, partial [Treponema sp.]|nr:hypothetical protein [Treponema sp.]
MKSFPKVFGITVVAMVIGFSIAACGDGDGGGGGGSSSAKTLTITGLPNTGTSSASSSIRVDIFSTIYSPYEGNSVWYYKDYVASGFEYIMSEDNIVTITISLLSSDDGINNWTGKGSYFIQLMYDNEYFYTNGKSLAELGITSSSTLEEVNAKMP